MEQAELAPLSAPLAAEAEPGTAPAIADPFAEARRLAPDARLVLFHDRRHDHQFILAVPPSSPWWPLLPPEQQTEIRAAMPAAEASA